MTIFIDGDFASGKACTYHCSPSCHPAQTGGESGTEWFYGCTHKVWPQNRAGDFVPIVFCAGEVSKCELRDTKFAAHYSRGLRQRKKNALAKVAALDAALVELDMLTKEPK